MEILITIVVVLLLIGVFSAFYEPNYKSEEINQKVFKEESFNNMSKSGDMKVKIDEIIEHYQLDGYTAWLLQNETKTFSEWLKKYGPMTWFSGGEDETSESRSQFVWTPGPGNSEGEWITNGFETSDYPEILSKGYFLATKPCDEEPYSIDITTGIYFGCTSCADNDDDKKGCSLCDEGFCWFDIAEMFDEIKVAK